MVQRRSDKHSPRIDDELEQEAEPLTDGAPVEGHSRPDLQAEPTAEGEPEIDPYVRPDFERAPGAPSDDELDARAELAQALRPDAFSATADQLVALVDGNEQATARMVATIRHLPTDRSYDNIQEVWEAIGGHVEGHHS